MFPSRMLLSLCTVLCLSLPRVSAAADTLMKVYLDAVENDPDIKSEHALYQAEVERQAVSHGRLLPSLVLTGEIARNREDVEVGVGATGTSGLSYFDSNRLELRLTQALYRKDVFADADRDEANARVAELEYRAAYQQFILRVVQAYMAVLAASNDLGYSRAERDAIGQQLADTKRRFRAGSATKADLYEAQASYDLSQSQVIVAETTLEDSKAALQEITDSQYNELTALPESFVPGFDGPYDIQHWLDKAERGNWELQVSRQQVEVLRYEVESASAGHYPELDVVARYRVEETGGRFGESDTDDKSIALQLTMPLYEGGQVSAEVRERNNRLLAEKERYNKTYRNIRRAVNNAYRSVNSSINQVNALRQAEVSAESALKAIRSGFDAGTRTTTDILDAQKELFRARRDLRQMQYRFIISFLELRSLSGELSEDDIRVVDAWLAS